MYLNMMKNCSHKTVMELFSVVLIDRFLKVLVEVTAPWQYLLLRICLFAFVAL